jgi:hypothetical protein
MKENQLIDKALKVLNLKMRSKQSRKRKSKAKKIKHQQSFENLLLANFKQKAQK